MTLDLVMRQAIIVSIVPFFVYSRAAARGLDHENQLLAKDIKSDVRTSAGVGEAIPPSVRVTKFLTVGPETAKKFRRNELEALSRHVGHPFFLLTGADLKWLSGQSDTFSRGVFRSWMPEGSPELSSGTIHSILRKTAMTYPLNRFGHTEGGPTLSVLIFVQAPDEMDEDYFRLGSGVDFQKGRILRPLFREAALLTAAHEATHARLNYLEAAIDNHPYLNSEYRAESGAYEFLRKHPQFFPFLKNTRIARAFWGGRRALKVLSVGAGDDGHDKLGFLSPSDMNPLANRQEILDKANHDLIIKLAVRLYSKKQLSPSPEHAFRSACSRLVNPWNYLLSNDSLYASSMDLKMKKEDYMELDTTGVFQSYLTNWKKINDGTISTALFEFQYTLKILYSDSASFPVDQSSKNTAFEFMKKYQIGQEDLDRFMESGMPLAAAFEMGWQQSVRDREGHLPTICRDGTSHCPGDKVMKRDDPSLVEALRAIRELYIEGAFNDSREQKIFAENALNGARFYGISF